MAWKHKKLFEHFPDITNKDSLPYHYQFVQLYHTTTELDEQGNEVVMPPQKELPSINIASYQIPETEVRVGFNKPISRFIENPDEK